MVSVPLMLDALVPAVPPENPDPEGADQLYVVPDGTTPLVTSAGDNVKAEALQVEAVIFVMEGVGFTVSVKVLPLLTHPLALETIIVPVYVIAAALAGIDIVMGLNGKIAFVTAGKPAGLQVMLYLVGLFVNALYVSEEVCAKVLKQTLVAVANVFMVGKGFMVRVNVFAVLTQPLELETVIVPVYVFAAALAGIEIVMRLAGKATFVMGVKPAGLQVILYVVGEPVTAL